jgi:IS5 family transposase
LKIARVVNRQSDKAHVRVTLEGNSDEQTNMWLEKVKHYQRLLKKVMNQTERRILNGETVPSSEKIVSIFEEHTDIIVKGLRDVQYGHKINVSTIKNGFVTQVTIEKGNPKDSSLYLPALKYHKDNFDVTPSSTACDGCYASRDNARQARKAGVKRTVFSKPVGLNMNDMGVKRKTFDRLKDFRAGVEGNISELKRCFGLSKSSWKKREGFEAFVWSSVLSYNLTHMARLQME